MFTTMPSSRVGCRDNHVKPFLVPMHEHVYECIQAGLTTLDGMDNDLESLYEGDISLTSPPIINRLTALTFLEDLSHYFRSSISTWYPEY